MKRIRLAVIGCGAAAEMMHIPAIQRTPELQIKVLVDPKAENLERLDKSFHLNAKLYNDYQDALKQEDFDAAVVLSPPKTHYKICMEYLKAGKHVFCEKPLTTTSREAISLSKQSAKSNRILMVGFNYRFLPQFRKIKELVDQGFIGKPIGAVAYALTDVTKWPAHTKFRYEPEGGGALFETGCHHIDLLCWILGKPMSVRAITQTRELKIPVDDTASVNLKFRENIMACIYVSWSAPYYNVLTILGSSGVAYSGSAMTHVYYHPKGVLGPPIQIRVEQIVSQIPMYRHFAKSIIKGKKPEANVDDAISVLKILEAAYKSAKENQEISLEDL